MKTVCIVTATRAEYGLLKPLIKALHEHQEIDVRIAVTGAHLSPEFGLTYRDIESDGFCIDEKIEMLLSADTPSAISKSMGLAMIGFADYLSRRKPDLLIVLGDRYESLSVAVAAMNQCVPIAHLYGGEATEGLIDESIRHAITKMSYLHFTSTESYRKRVIQLGESPERVHNVGAIGVENVKKVKLMDYDTITEELGIEKGKPYVVFTYHPVTLENQSAKEQMHEILRVIDRYKAYQYVFTKSNADAEGRIINDMIETYTHRNEHCKVFASLGVRKYLSAVKYCEMVIGNSSSGIIEVPSFHVPTINIGDRQKGRVQAESVINAEPLFDDLCNAIEKARAQQFRTRLADIVNPYEKSDTVERIVTCIEDLLKNDEIDIKKKFYDL